MLEILTERLVDVVKRMRSQARLTEENTQAMLREVRIALLEADVTLPVVQHFIERVKEKSLGEAVLQSLSPGQTLVGIVQDELIRLMGGDDLAACALNLTTTPPAIILMVGLQGSGKTTTTAKLAKWLLQQKKKVLTVSCDIYRPAAIAQLKMVTEQVGADFFAAQSDQKPIEIAQAAQSWAQKHHYDVMLVDTAGRLGIDEAMMQEIGLLHAALKPIETLFIIDAMLGQDAVNTAKAFHQTLPLTGVVLTKSDGDARGGAALSVREITGCPIKFLGTGEKLAQLEAFDPDRIARRILGMGDIVSLVETAKKNINLSTIEKLAAKIKKGNQFDLNDFKAQMVQMKNMGGLSTLLDKLPAQLQAQAKHMQRDDTEKQIRRMEGMINSMTPGERKRPEIIKANRKRRIAAGSGTTVQEINRMLAQYDQIRTMMKKFKGSGSLMKMIRGLGF